jgi:hypothetical protein
MKKTFYALAFSIITVTNLIALNTPKISIQPDTIDKSGTVTIKVIADNSGKKFNGCTFNLSTQIGAVGYMEDSISDFGDSIIFTKKYTIGSSDFPGFYSLNRITLWEMNTGYGNGIVFEYQNLGFRVVNTTPDTIAPELKNFKISRNSAGPLDTVYISFDVVDTLSGDGIISLSLFDTTSNSISCFSFIDNQNGTKYKSVKAKYIVGRFEVPGKRNISVLLTDQKGNSRKLVTADLGFSLTITGTKPDKTAPLLRNITSIEINDSLFLELTIFEKVSGVRTINCYLSNNGGFMPYIYGDKVIKVNDSIFRLNLNRYTPSGEYRTQTNLYDSAANVSWAMDTFNITNSKSDDVPPILESIEIDNDTVFSNGNLKIKINVSDNSSGIATIIGTIRSIEYSRYVDFYEGINTLNIKDTIITKEIHLPQYGPSGTWTIEAINVYDHARIRDTTTDIPVNFTYLSKYEDVTPPIFDTIFFEPREVKPGDTVIATIKASDDISGIKTIQYKDDFENKFGKRIWNRIDDNTFQSIIAIPKYSETKVIYFQLERITDNAENYKHIGTGYAAFKIVNDGIADVKPPVFDSLKISPVKAGPNDIIDFSFYLHDDISGIEEEYLFAAFSYGDYINDIMKEYGIEFIYLFPKKYAKNEYRCQLKPGIILPNKYTFIYMNMIDSAKNTTDFEVKDYSDLGYSFEITGPKQSDKVKPKLLDIKANPSIASPYSRVTFELKVLEKESALMAIDATVKNTDGVEEYKLPLEDWIITEKNDTFTCRGNFMVPKNASSGKWALNKIILIDYYVNDASYSYNIDYTGGSFEVNGLSYTNRVPCFILSSVNITIDAGSTLEYTLPDYIVSDIDGDNLTYKALMKGSQNLQPWISFNADKRKFTFKPTNQNAGDRYIYVYATDPDGLKDSLAVNVKVKYVDIPESVDNIKTGTLNIYPNPAHDYVKINSNYSIKGIAVYDILGKIVMEENKNLSLINVSTIEPGRYIIKVETDKMTLIDRLIIE